MPVRGGERTGRVTGGPDRPYPRWLDPGEVGRYLHRVVDGPPPETVRAESARTPPPPDGIRAAVLKDGFDADACRDLWRITAHRALYHDAPADAYAAIMERRRLAGNGRDAVPAGGPAWSGGRRIVVYSAITGDYEPVQVPQIVLPGVDHVIFADRPVMVADGIAVRATGYHSTDPVRTARYAKLHPHVLLAGYDLAIWLDANVFVADDITDIVADHIVARAAVGAVAHPERTSPYQEAAACLAYGKDDPDIIRRQMELYDRLGFDCDDLIESSFLAFDLRHPGMARFLATWWAEIDGHSRRDQLSFNYAIQANRLSWRPLVPPPHSLRSHPKFLLLPHGRDRPASLPAIGGRVVSAEAETPFAMVRRERIAAQKQRSIDVVVCVKDALADVRRCLESLRTAAACAKRRLILVDDGSGADTRACLDAFAAGRDDVIIERNAAPRGYTRAANQGLLRSSAEMVILLNSDTVVTDWWAEKLADALFRTPGAGIVGPLSNAASWQSLPSIEGSGGQTAVNPLPPGVSPNNLNALCETWTGGGVLPRVPLVHGFCFGIARQVIDRIGHFDDHHFPEGYGEENDFCFRATDAGFDGVIATHTYVFHAKTRSYAAADRSRLSAAGGSVLADLYGAPRIARATASMAAHPALVRLREQAAAWYDGRRGGTAVAPSDAAAGDGAASGHG